LRSATLRIIHLTFNPLLSLRIYPHQEHLDGSQHFQSSSEFKKNSVNGSYLGAITLSILF